MAKKKVTKGLSMQKGKSMVGADLHGLMKAGTKESGN